MSELIEFIKAENDKDRKRMELEPGLMCGLLVEDEKWWAGHDVHTVEDFKRWEMTSVMSDLAKDAYGTRSACPDISNMSLKELEECYDSLCKAADAAVDEEREWQKKSIAEFEAAVANAIELGAGDRDNAIKWLRDAEQDEHAERDDNYFEYCNNLPYGYISGQRPGWLA